jgi:hypothetical protein
MASLLGRYGGADVHLAMARRFWQEDRLREADAAMEQALRAGLPPGDFYDLQRTIEAELGARTAGEIRRIDEHALIEADPDAWGDAWPELVAGVRSAVAEVGDRLGVRWGRPTLVTLVPNDEWVQFVHARYGYYRERVPWHKVCLPPSAILPLSVFARAVRHEVSHAAIHQLAGDEAPRWLDEGIAVLMEGGARPDERRRYLLAAARGGRPALDEVSALLEGYDLDLSSGRAGICYAAAGDFAAWLLDRGGWSGLAQILRRVGHGETVDRAIRRAIGTDRRRLEREWLSAAG